MSYSFVFLCLIAVLPVASSTPSGTWTFDTNCDVSWYKASKFDYTIDSAKKLAGLAKLVNDGKSFSGMTITLTKDIDLGAHYWEQIGKNDKTPFEGTFDGGSKMISNIVLDENSDYVGLFGYAKGTIKNVQISGTITSSSTSSCVGGIVGWCDACSISGCTNEADVSGSLQVGGINGCSHKSIIQNCQNKGIVSGKYAGGISGGRDVNSYYVWDTTTINNSINTGRVSASDTAGGIVGHGTYEYFVITNCYNLGTIGGASSFGISGATKSADNTHYFNGIYNCYNNGDVSSNEIAPSFSAAYSLCMFVDYSYGRSGKTVGGSVYAKHRGTFTSAGALTPLSDESIINKCNNLVDALNAYVAQEKGKNPTLLEWMKGSGGVPAVFAQYVTVNFNANGGTVSPSSKQVGLFSTYGQLPIPTQSGYEFNGWYTAQTGGTVVSDTTEVTTEADHTLYAHWLKKVTVTLNPTGGSVNPSTITVVETKQYTGLVEAARSGYFFIGWFTSESGGTQVTSTTPVTNNNNHMLYAQWRKAVTVTFNYLGGSGSGSTKVVGLGMTYGVLPAPTRTGFYFDGWFTSADGGTLVTSDTPVTNSNDHQIYAHWTKGFTVTLNTNGGTILTTELKYKVTDSVYGTIPKPTKGLSVFLGWFTEMNGGSLVGSTTPINPKNDHTLYAHWTNKYQVTLDPNGGTVSSSSFVYEEGSVYGELPEAQQKGKKFLGWFTAKSSGSKVNRDSIISSRNHTLYAQWVNVYAVTLDPNGGVSSVSLIVYEEGSTYGELPEAQQSSKKFLGWFTGKSGGLKVNSNNKVERKDHTLYAHWISEYTVTFDPNGGTASVASMVYEEGSVYGELPEAQKTDKKFLGWFTGKTGGSKVNEDSIIINRNHKLYAHWGELTFTITYNTNGGSSIVPTALEKGAPIMLPEITKEGFIFEGWFLDPNFMEPFTLTEMPAHNIVLHAKWGKDNNMTILVAVVVPIGCAVLGVVGSIIGAWHCGCCCWKGRKAHTSQGTEMNPTHQATQHSSSNNRP